MADGYKNAGEHEFDDLDEWLCEYVDGTIDPAVCSALEEYMQHNEELAAHVERLRETRHLLCQFGCSYQAPSGLQPRLRRRLATEIIQESQPLLGGSGTHLIVLATLTSVVAILLIFAASGEAVAPDALPTTAQKSIVKEFSPESAREASPNRRATPVRILETNKFYSKFTHQISYTSTYLSPSFLPANVYATPQVIDASLRQADFQVAMYPTP
ncbi:MAG: anti-sigma factor [Rhodothermales bacterium]